MLGRKMEFSTEYTIFFRQTQGRIFEKRDILREEKFILIYDIYVIYKEKIFRKLKIDSATIGMESARNYTSYRTRTVQFRVQIGSLETGINQEPNSANDTENEVGEEVEELENHKNVLQNTKSVFQIKQIDLGEERRAIDQIRQQCILYLWSLFFGQQKAKELAEKYGMSDYNTGTTSIQPAGQPLTMMEATPFTGNVMTKTVTEQFLFEEQENTNFATNGTVTTADGRTIDFQMKINMSRSFQQVTQTNVTQIQKMCDPLVINLNQNIASLSDQTFYFDLEGDGEAEEVSMLKEGSGYLALDKNQDGVINDGTELFGTASGDGFADLAKYDQDGNGWIDENDAVFDQLKIWVQSKEGGALYSLKEQGVGAIYLGNQSTDFGQRNLDGTMAGQIRSTGLFLYENGAVGSVQQIDLANHSLEKLA